MNFGADSDALEERRRQLKEEAALEYRRHIGAAPPPKPKIDPNRTASESWWEPPSGQEEQPARPVSREQRPSNESPWGEGSQVESQAQARPVSREHQRSEAWFEEAPASATAPGPQSPARPPSREHRTSEGWFDDAGEASVQQHDRPPPRLDPREHRTSDIWYAEAPEEAPAEQPQQRPPSREHRTSDVWYNEDEVASTQPAEQPQQRPPSREHRTSDVWYNEDEVAKTQPAEQARPVSREHRSSQNSPWSEEPPAQPQVRPRSREHRPSDNSPWSENPAQAQQQQPSRPTPRDFRTSVDWHSENPADSQPAPTRIVRRDTQPSEGWYGDEGAATSQRQGGHRPGLVRRDTKPSESWWGGEDDPAAHAPRAAAGAPSGRPAWGQEPPRPQQHATKTALWTGSSQQRRQTEEHHVTWREDVTVGTVAAQVSPPPARPRQAWGEDSQGLSSSNHVDKRHDSPSEPARAPVTNGIMSAPEDRAPASGSVSAAASSLPNIPEQHTAVMCCGPSDYRVVKDRATPVPGALQVLLRISSCGICASDCKCYAGAGMFWGRDNREDAAGARFDPEKAWVKPPVVPGHEFYGVVAALGEGADAHFADANGEKLALGQRVIAEQIVPCDRCRFCRSGQHWMCQVHNIFGFQKQVADGGMSEFMLLPRTARIHRIPEEVSHRNAAIIEPLACAVHAVQRADPQLSDVVVLAGAGPIGLMMVQVLRLRTPRCLVVIDMSEERLALAKLYGADVVINPRDGPGAVKEQVDALTQGYGCDVYIEATGNPAGVSQGLSLIRKLGRFVEFSVFGRDASVDWSIIGDRKELDVRGAHLGGLDGYEVAIDLLKRDLVTAEGIVTHEYPLEDFDTAIAMAAGMDSIKVLLTPGAGATKY